ncbi:MAG: hypothetical protein FGF53_03015 [Candidatus Brockarchaeota archaeon]|nr:hypothetical protein [Candidatus Brockarchaeota archaeon]MBO3808424.1 hypothetical protein [Candidatus Brockarchaeota archaeon]
MKSVGARWWTTCLTGQKTHKRIKACFQHHIYVVDAIRIVSAKQVGARMLVAGDVRLAEASMAEVLETPCLT